MEWWLKKTSDQVGLCFGDNKNEEKEIVSIRPANRPDHVKVSCKKDLHVLDLHQFRRKNEFSENFRHCGTSRTLFYEKWKTIAGVEGETSSLSGNSQGSNSSVDDGPSPVPPPCLNAKFLGYHEVDCLKLVEPEWTRLHRSSSEKQVQQLVKEFAEHPSSYFHLLVVNIPNLNSKQFFDDKKLNGEYSLETIGGNHSRLALQELCKGDQHEQFRRRLVKTYFNLTPEEARLVGRESNRVHQLALKEDFLTEVEEFRAMLFVTAGTVCKKAMEEDEPPTDTNIIQRWKLALQSLTASRDRKSFNNRYRLKVALAQAPNAFWVLLMELRKKGGQKLSSYTLKCLDPGTCVANLGKVIPLLHQVLHSEITFKVFHDLALETLGKLKKPTSSRKRKPSLPHGEEALVPANPGEGSSTLDHETSMTGKEEEMAFLRREVDRLKTENAVLQKKLQLYEQEKDEEKATEGLVIAQFRKKKFLALWETEKLTFCKKALSGSPFVRDSLTLNVKDFLPRHQVHLQYLQGPISSSLYNVESGVIHPNGDFGDVVLSLL